MKTTTAHTPRHQLFRGGDNPIAALSAIAGERGLKNNPETAAAVINLERLAMQMTVGDVVFIRVPAKPFREVATATASWTNHVGVVIASDPTGVFIAESTFPFARKTTLDRFIDRSTDGRVAVSRLRTPLARTQVERLLNAVERRLGTFYDTGFNLHSRRQFCSRFVREVLDEATGIQVGEVETFAQLLNRRPGADLSFWTAWYFGRIPWSRETVTPASLLVSPDLEPVFDGVAKNYRVSAH